MEGNEIGRLDTWLLKVAIPQSEKSSWMMDEFLRVEILRAKCLLNGGYHTIGMTARAMFRYQDNPSSPFALIIKLMLKLADVSEMLLTPCQGLAATP